MNLSKLAITKIKVNYAHKEMIHNLNSKCREYLELSKFPMQIDQFGVGIRTLQLKFRVPNLFAIKHRIFEEMKNETQYNH